MMIMPQPASPAAFCCTFFAVQKENKESKKMKKKVKNSKNSAY